MSPYYYLILFDLIAVSIIAAVIYKLATSRPEDQTRIHMAEVVQTIVDMFPWKKSANVRTPHFEDRHLEADLMARMILTSRPGPAAGDHAGEHPDHDPHVSRPAGVAAKGTVPDP